MRVRTVTSALVDDHEAAAVDAAVRVVALAETLKIVRPAQPGPGVTLDEIRVAFEEFAKQGVGRHIGPLPTHLSADDLATTSRRLLAAAEGSPMPSLEWPTMIEVLGDDLLMRLLGVGSSSLHRYRNGERPTPDAVAGRLHMVTQIVSDLRGSYNDFGIRRWFHRPRAQLDGAAPVDLLAGAWSADDEATSRVRDLARALTGAGG